MCVWSGRSLDDTLLAAGPVLAGLNGVGVDVLAAPLWWAPVPSTGRPRPRWYGTIVTLQCGGSLSAATMASACGRAAGGARPWCTRGGG